MIGASVGRYMPPTVAVGTLPHALFNARSLPLGDHLIKTVAAVGHFCHTRWLPPSPRSASSGRCDNAIAGGPHDVSTL
jgi:hypothetical protein